VRINRLLRLIVFAVALLPMPLFSDELFDLSIFSVVKPNVEPNVMIIFDNSGSMKDAPYDPNTRYDYKADVSCLYEYNDNQDLWYKVSNISIGSDGYVDASEISCEDARYKLNFSGFYDGVIYLSGSNKGKCLDGAGRHYIGTGNYVNFYRLNQNRSLKSKLSIAKDTVASIINSYTGVRFGIMVFNDSYTVSRSYTQCDGGYVLAPVATRTDDEKNGLIALINRISADTSTPLAETLAEAGLYFAGKKSWANNNVTYQSPVQYRCQPNYVIVMTDGAPTADRGSILTKSDYLWGLSIGDFDKDGVEKQPEDQSVYEGGYYLDDVAKFLHDVDLLRGKHSFPDYTEDFDKTDYPKQNIKTYTIGFDIDNALLKSTADSAHGDGLSFTTKGGINLSDIFKSILDNISKRDTAFVSPVVPVNRVNKTYADNSIYISLFKPDSSGFWFGNLKKFALDDDGVILGRDGKVAVDSDGVIAAAAHSIWSNVSGSEGLAADIGGVGQMLLTQADPVRTFYTNATLANGAALAGCPFYGADGKVNAALKPEDFGLGTSDSAKRDDLIDYVCARGIYSPSSGSSKRNWVLGDIVHSEPAVFQPDPNGNLNVIFVGANDGFLHCFVDDDKGNNYIKEDNLAPNYTDDSVKEAWAFMPWELRGKLKNLPPVGATTLPGDKNHDFFVDGSPRVYSLGSSYYVVFGLRRGGKGYYCLNITDYANPKLAWTVSSEILGSSATLGQSWVEPKLINIKQSPSDTSGRKLILLAGGYDDANQDKTAPAAIDTYGRSVFAVDAATGALNNAIKFFDSEGATNFKHCIVDLAVYNSNPDVDDFDDTIYAPTLGGELYCFNDRNGDGTWNYIKLFDAESAILKFFNAPAVVQMAGGDYLYLGSGNRENPGEMSVVNKFFCIRNKFDSAGITLAKLHNVTTPIEDQTGSGTTLPRDLLAKADGWYFDLPNSGEKCVSSALVYDGKVFFTTFTPTVAASSSTVDKCATGNGAGVARLYVVDYKTGSAVRDLDDNGVKERSTVIGSGIATNLVVVATKNGDHLEVATQDRVITVDTGTTQTLVPYYWKQL